MRNKDKLPKVTAHKRKNHNLAQGHLALAFALLTIVFHSLTDMGYLILLFFVHMITFLNYVCEAAIHRKF